MLLVLVLVLFWILLQLLLLCDGQVAYYGDVTHCASFFSDIELPCPPNYNLADHICKYRASQAVPGSC